MTMTSKIISRLGMALIAGFAFTASGALAADYPDKPVQLMVSYPPGGATDFQARIVTMMSSNYIKEPIVIINKGGAGGQVGWNWFASSASKDGYELGAYNLPHFIAQSIMFKTKRGPDGARAHDRDCSNRASVVSGAAQRGAQGAVSAANFAAGMARRKT